LAERIQPGDEVKVYAEGPRLALPQDLKTPIIMIGPAPDRAVPRVPARPQGDRRARQELAVLRPSAQRIRFLLCR
jgi:hypothetical protein